MRVYAQVYVYVCARWSHLAVLHRELVQQHAHVVRLPLPVLVAEVLQQADGLVEPVEDTHHPGGMGGGQRETKRDKERDREAKRGRREKRAEEGMKERKIKGKKGG